MTENYINGVKVDNVIYSLKDETALHGSVETANISNSAITEDKIADGSVSESKLTDSLRNMISNSSSGGSGEWVNFEPQNLIYKTRNDSCGMQFYQYNDMWFIYNLYHKYNFEGILIHPQYKIVMSDTMQYNLNTNEIRMFSELKKLDSTDLSKISSAISYTTSTAAPSSFNGCTTMSGTYSPISSVSSLFNSYEDSGSTYYSLNLNQINGQYSNILCAFELPSSLKLIPLSVKSTQHVSACIPIAHAGYNQYIDENGTMHCDKVENVVFDTPGFYFNANGQSTIQGPSMMNGNIPYVLSSINNNLLGYANMEASGGTYPNIYYNQMSPCFDIIDYNVTETENPIKIETSVGADLLNTLPDLTFQNSSPVLTGNAGPMDFGAGYYTDFQSWNPAEGNMTTPSSSEGTLYKVTTNPDKFLISLVMSWTLNCIPRTIIEEFNA